MTFRTILLDHFHRYPIMEIVDVYKLVHQAAMGPGHAVDDVEAALSWLMSELEGMGEGPGESEIDPVSGETGMVRVHLRPFHARGGNPETLLAAFLRSAKEHHRNFRLLDDYWEVFLDLADRDEVPVASEEARVFYRRLSAQGFPALHHSAEYARHYRPAYRVIKAEYLGRFEK